MYKFKYDEITDSELNDFYLKIKNMLWWWIEKSFFRADKNDVFQDIWLHLTNQKHKWKEESPNMVSSWMWFVISNWIKTIKYYEARKNRSQICFSDFVLTETEDADDLLGRYCDNRQDRTLLCEAIRQWESTLTGEKKLYVQLLIDPGNDILSLVNSKKKYYSEKISKVDMAQMMHVPVWKLDIIRNELSKELKRFLDDRTELLFYGGKLPGPL